MNIQADLKDADAKANHKLISITVDGNKFELEKDKYFVSDLKQLVNVPADYELDEVIDGVFTPLADTAEIHLKKDAVFVSHVRQGGSS